MLGVSKTILIGTITQQPETSVTGNGVAVTKLNLVTNEKYKSKPTKILLENYFIRTIPLNIIIGIKNTFAPHVSCCCKVVSM